MKRNNQQNKSFLLLICFFIIAFALIIIVPTPMPNPTANSTPKPTLKPKPIRTGAPITWSQGKLALTDFIATPNKNSQRDGESKVGIIVSWLPVIKSHGQNGSTFNCTVGSQKFQSYSQFIPRESWIKPEAYNNLTLRHEQLHFDIAEIYARRLRLKSGEILSMTESATADDVNAACQKANTVLSSRVDQIINDIDQQEAVMQAQLDSNPNHLDGIPQTVEWENKVHSLL